MVPESVIWYNQLNEDISAKKNHDKIKTLSTKYIQKEFGANLPSKFVENK